MEYYVVTVGSSSLDTYYESDYWPHLGDKAMVRYLDIKVGGLISNAACAMAACGLSTYMIDCVGADAQKIVFEELHRYGVNTGHITIDPNYQQSATNIYLVGGEKVIFINKNKPIIKLNEKQTNLILRAAAVYSILPEIKLLSGYQELLQEMKQCSVKLVLDIETATFGDNAEDRALLEQADILFFNRQGMDKYSGDQSVRKSLDHLLDCGVSVVVVTLADQGCMIVTREMTFEVPGIPVHVTDATGAGDTFNSTFLFGMLNNWDLKRCARLANAAGARAVTLAGPKSGAADVETLLQFLRDHTLPYKGGSDG